MTTDITHRWIATNRIRLHIAEAGPTQGPLVVLLHGFPEFWYGWRRQILPLAAAGSHVIAPDQRGYNLSDKPEKIRDYATYWVQHEEPDRLNTLLIDFLGH